MLCEDCSTEHLEHLDQIESWDAVLKHNLSRLHNYEHRVRIILKQTDNIDRLKKLIRDNVSKSMGLVNQKVEEFKDIVQDKIWDDVSKDKGKLEDAENVEELTSLYGRLEVVIGKFEDKGMGKEELIALLQQGDADNFEAQIAKFSSLKQGEIRFVRELEGLKFSDASMYDRFVKFIQPRKIVYKELGTITQEEEKEEPKPVEKKKELPMWMLVAAGAIIMLILDLLIRYLFFSTDCTDCPKV